MYLYLGDEMTSKSDTCDDIVYPRVKHYIFTANNIPYVNKCDAKEYINEDLNVCPDNQKLDLY